MHKEIIRWNQQQIKVKEGMIIVHLHLCVGKFSWDAWTYNGIYVIARNGLHSSENKSWSDDFKKVPILKKSEVTRRWLIRILALLRDSEEGFSLHFCPLISLLHAVQLLTMLIPWFSGAYSLMRNQSFFPPLQKCLEKTYQYDSPEFPESFHSLMNPIFLVVDTIIKTQIWKKLDSNSFQNKRFNWGI